MGTTTPNSGPDFNRFKTALLGGEPAPAGAVAGDVAVGEDAEAIAGAGDIDTRSVVILYDAASDRSNRGQAELRGALAVWEWFARRGVAWMQGRWWPRIVAVLTLIVVVSGSLFYIFDIGFGDRDSWLILSGPVSFVAFAAASLWYYQFRQSDLFTLTATLLGGIVAGLTKRAGRVPWPRGGVLAGRPD